MCFAKAHGRFKSSLIRIGIKAFGDKHCDKLIMKLCQSPEFRKEGISAEDLMKLPLPEKKMFLLSVFNIAEKAQPEKVASVENAEAIKSQKSVMTEEGKKESIGIGNNVIAIEIAMNVLLFIFAHMFWFPLGSIVVLAGRFINRIKEKKEEKENSQNLTESSKSIFLEKVEKEVAKIPESKINEFIEKMYKDMDSKKVLELPVENKRNIILNLFRAAADIKEKFITEEIGATIIGASIVSILGTIVSSLITPYMKMGIDKLILDRQFKKVVAATEIENVKTQEEYEKIIKKYNSITVGMEESNIIKILGKNYSESTVKGIKKISYMFSFGVASRQSYSFKGVRQVVKADQKDIDIIITLSDDNTVLDKEIKIKSK